MKEIGVRNFRCFREDQAEPELMDEPVLTLKRMNSVPGTSACFGTVKDGWAALTLGWSSQVGWLTWTCKSVFGCRKSLGGQGAWYAGPTRANDTKLQTVKRIRAVSQFGVHADHWAPKDRSSHAGPQTVKRIRAASQFGVHADTFRIGAASQSGVRADHFWIRPVSQSGFHADHWTPEDRCSRACCSFRSCTSGPRSFGRRGEGSVRACRCC